MAAQHARGAVPHNPRRGCSALLTSRACERSAKPSAHGRVLAVCFACQAGAWSQDASDVDPHARRGAAGDRRLEVHGAAGRVARAAAAHLREPRVRAGLGHAAPDRRPARDDRRELSRRASIRTTTTLQALRAVRSSVTDLAALAPSERAELDILLTDSIIRLGYHLRFGKVDPNALDPNWNSTRELFGEDPAVTIQAAIDSPSLREFAARAIPRAFLYERFKNALAEYRALEANGGWPTVPAGATLQPGGTRRARACARGAPRRHGRAAGRRPPSTARSTTRRSSTAVRRFQARHGLAPTAPSALRRSRRSTCRSRRASSSCARISSALAGCSTIPRASILVVNIAGFQLYLLRRGEVVWRARVQVGRPYRQTPIFRAEMTYLVVNPTWTVPPTIFRNDILPRCGAIRPISPRATSTLFDSSNARVDPARGGLVRAQLPVPARAAARSRQRARPHQVHVPERARRLSARHAEPRSVRSRQPGLQLGLHSRRESVRARRAAVAAGGARERLDAVVASGRTETMFLDKPMTIMLLYWTARGRRGGASLVLPDVYDRDADVIGGARRALRPTRRL